ncbi:hypothetical protein FQN60_007131, partial [Etheostoma spectabile]
MCPRNPAKITQ